MDFELNEEQLMLREVSRSMLRTTCTPQLVRSTMEAGLDTDDKLWQRVTELGWTSLAVPEDAGGAGQGLVELCLVAEEIGRAVAPGPFLESALAAAAAASGGAPAHLVEALAEGTQRATVAETAELIHAAGSCDLVLVLDEDPRFVPVVEARRRTTIDQTRGWYSAELAPPTADGATRLDIDAAWWRHAMTLLTAADALGVGEQLLEMTVSYTAVREQFGRSIGSFQAVKHKAAEMLIVLKGARAAIYRAAMALDAHASDGALWTSVAKATASDGVADVAGNALQLHGGIGFTWEHDLHLYLRRAKVAQATWGSSSSHYETVAALLRVNDDS